MNSVKLPLPPLPEGAATDVAEPAQPAGLLERAMQAHQPALLSFLRWKLGSDADVRDAEQDTWSRLLRYCRPGQDEISRTLVMRVAESVVIDRVRYDKAHHAARHVPLEGLEFEAKQATPEQLLADQQHLAAVKQEILRLPSRCREVFIRSRIYGMSHTDIACELGISHKAVERQITRALHQLRRRVGEPGA